MDNTPNPPLLKRIDNFVRGLANGLTFGQADTIAAAGDTIVGAVVRGSDRKTIAASFEENQREQIARTAQAHTEGTAVKDGEALGVIGLSLGVFRAVGGFKQIVESGMRYKDVLFNTGRAIAHRNPRELNIVMGRALNTVGTISRRETIIAAGGGIVSAQINARKLEDATTRAETPATPRNPSFRP